MKSPSHLTASVLFVCLFVCLFLCFFFASTGAVDISENSFNFFSSFAVSRILLKKIDLFCKVPKLSVILR